MSRELVLEIGTEEIPAAYLPPALDQIRQLAEKELTALRVPFGETRAYATPRRIVLHVTGVAGRQETSVKQVMGPATNVAYDDKGNPTKAAEGFARGQGIKVRDLTVVLTPKGEYVAAVRSEASRPTADILPQIMPRIITSLHFPKFQRWGYMSLRFPRPIRWILCLFGSDVVDFDLEGIRSGRMMRGHRFMAPGPFEIRDTKDYFLQVRKAKVVLDQDERRGIISEGVRKAAEKVGGKAIPDNELINEVTYLVEYPVIVTGTYEDRYLALPREVLITSMRSHQRYFTVTNRNNRLLPYFITISNNVVKSSKVVAHGNERVLRARLEDAMFFYQEDRKVSQKARAEELKDVVFQQKLGTSWEKMERFSSLAAAIVRKVEPDAVKEVKRVAYLCKSDLVSQMVCEFAELQGVMGREYALLEGEDKAVADGILEHYYPRYSGDRTPKTAGGAAVSIADRMDTVCGCFGIGITPTGTADPYGLRRHALAIIAILMDRGWRVSLTDLMKQSLRLLGDKTDVPPKEALEGLEEFFRGRLHNLFTGRGYRHDVVSAVLADHWRDPVDAAARIDALTAFSRKAGFADLMLSFKRVMNIIPVGFRGKVDRPTAGQKVEKGLIDSATAVGRDAAASLDKGEYLKVLNTLAKMKKPVDAFFDGVMVMDEDPAAQKNRLAILGTVSELFARVADFRKIVTDKESAFEPVADS
ncbi:MAG: glycine--tRNA ligase subunit beta [bacterium]|nr:glycine--tRNA ligase subunit beta [bacterium]MDT8396608.1 glycine--tRNA ligase subunit beta [bacterium]